MPEGDNILQHARLLAARFVGRKLHEATRGGVREPVLDGASLQGARSVGKHLLLSFGAQDGEVRIRVHLGIAGRWRIGALGDFSAAARIASPLCLDFGDQVAFVFRPKEITLERAALADSMPIARLGPDLLGPDPDYAEILRRARRPEYAAGPLGELLLTQAVAAGIGNVYKSEVCFLEALHPFLRVDEVDDAALLRVYRLTAKLLASNLGPWRRTTTADLSTGEQPSRGQGRTWVYGRAGRRCYRCTSLIERRAMGPDVRSTFYCPKCQAP